MAKHTTLEIGVILLNSRVQTITFNFVIPESFNRSTLYHDNYSGRSVDGELKDHERIQESSPHNELLDNFDQEKREGYTSKAGAHHVKRLLDVVVLECLNTPCWVKGR